MKLILFILGLLLIILGSLSFALIAVVNKYLEINSSIPILLIVIGGFLIFLGIISMIFFIKEDKTKKEVEYGKSK